MAIDKLNDNCFHFLHLELNNRFNPLEIEFPLHLGGDLFELPHEGVPHLFGFIVYELVNSRHYERLHLSTIFGPF